MCGRFALWRSKAALQAAFPDFEFPEEMPECYNIAPTAPVAVVPNDGERAVQLYRWGLVPGWSDGPSSRYTMINARSETAAEKPAFRAAYRHRRCLILADGFYEWTKRAGDRRKTPMYVRLASDAPLAFAGLWEVWQPQGQADAQPLYSCTILTTDANDLIAPVHPRMPVILSPENYNRWLTPEEARPEDLDPILAPYPSEELTMYEVSKTVNSPQNDGPGCIKPLP